MKANTVRLLAGGFAATIIMTNMAAMPVLANETSTSADFAIETVVEEAPTAEEIAVPTEEAQTTEETTVPETEEIQAAEEAATTTTDETLEVEEAATPAAEETQAAEEAATPATDEIQPAEEAAAPEAEEIQTAEKVAVQETTEAAASTDTLTEKTVADADNTQSKQEENVKAEPAKEAAVSTEKESDTYVPTEEEIKLIDEEAEIVASRIKSIDELMKLLITQDTTVVYPEGTKTDNGDRTAPNTRLSFDKAVMSAAYGKALDTLIKKIPGGEYICDPVKNMVLKMIGLKADDFALQKMIYERAYDTNVKIDELKGETKRAIETIGSIRSYGERIDAFANSSFSLARGIEYIKKDGSLSDNEKAVMIAALIGGSDKWIPGTESIFSKMDSAAQTMRSLANNGPSADPNSRNLFQLFYDYNKETSMFSGEAMNKANPAIKKRTNDYVLSCEVLFEALKAHEKVASLTDSEVKELPDEIQQTYKNIKSNKKTVQLYMKNVIETFTGDKESEIEGNKIGILDAAKEYYNKNPRLYIDKNGEDIKEIALAYRMYTINSEKYNNDVLKNNSAINSEQVKKLQQHVNSLDMTMSDYLKQYGFDIKTIEETGRHARLSTLHDERQLLPNSNEKTYYAINMTEKNATEKGTVYYQFYNGKYRVFQERERDALLAIFVTPEKADKLMGMEIVYISEDGKEIEHPIIDLTDVIEEKPAEPEKSTWDKVGDFFKSLWPF